MLGFDILTVTESLWGVMVAGGESAGTTESQELNAIASTSRILTYIARHNFVKLTPTAQIKNSSLC
jgi:hypothetical protein